MAPERKLKRPAVELDLANGDVLLVDENHGEQLRKAGALIVTKGRPKVVDQQGRVRTILSVLGLRGWKPLDNNWFDLRSDRLVKAGGDRSCAGKGVFRSAETGRWRAWVMEGGQKRYLGSYATEEEALAARSRERAALTSG